MNDLQSSGILLLDKEAGVTSRQLDNLAQRAFHTRKVGHLGTLDPFATGLLLLAVNDATKYLPFLPDEEKTYVASLRLGKATDTGDLTGNETIRKDVPSLDESKIIEVLRSFLGEGTQIPPMTSAIKKDGVALYRLAHKGMEVEREPRPIYIHDIRLLSYQEGVLEFETTVSKGTYIRVLGEDIALRLGTVGHLIALRRTKVGDITLEGSIRASDLPSATLLPAYRFVPYKHIQAKDEEIKKVRNGVPISFNEMDQRLLIMDGETPLAVYEKDGERYRCLRGL